MSSLYRVQKSQYLPVNHVIKPYIPAGYWTVTGADSSESVTLCKCVDIMPCLNFEIISGMLFQPPRTRRPNTENALLATSRIPKKSYEDLVNSDRSEVTWRFIDFLSTLNLVINTSLSCLGALKSCDEIKTGYSVPLCRNLIRLYSFAWKTGFLIPLVFLFFFERSSTHLYHKNDLCGLYKDGLRRASKWTPLGKKEAKEKEGDMETCSKENAGEQRSDVGDSLNVCTPVLQGT